MTGSSVVVTGSSSGIGAGIARELLARGWQVVGLDLTEPAVNGGHPGLRTVVGDVADPACHAEAADVAESLAPLRGWVNCAGYNIFGTVAMLDVASLRRGVDVDLLGVFFGCAEAARRYLEHPLDARRCAIVNISSIQASTGFRGFAAYAMCKRGIEALTRQVAAEYVGQGIRSNAVAPGLVASPMNDALLARSLDPDALRRSWEALTPIGRSGRPEDIGAAVTFLLDERESGFITGEVLHVNGGATIIARGEAETR